MAPEGFAVIVPSPGISPLGLVASTAFSVRSKSNHLLSLWAVDPRPQWERRANRTTQTLTCVMESRTIQRELPMTAVIMTLWNSEKSEILKSIFYSCTSSREFQKKKNMSIASNAEGWGPPGRFCLLFISFFPSVHVYMVKGVCLQEWHSWEGRGARLNYSIQISTKPSEIMYENRHGGRQPALKGVLIVISSHFGFSTAGLWGLHPGVTGRGAWSMLMDLGYTELMLPFSEQ